MQCCRAPTPSKAWGRLARQQQQAREAASVRAQSEAVRSGVSFMVAAVKARMGGASRRWALSLASLPCLTC